MKQILQSLNNGKTELADIPCPQVKSGHLLIRTSTSIVSAGTERMLVEFGKAGLISKARQQPDKVRMVVDKIKTDGLMPTIDSVRSKLDQPLPLGYCNVGVVLEVGKGVEGFSAGDRVVSNGHHAEVVCIPKNLCARIPDEVSDEAAAFTVIGAIGMQGIRLAQPALGETFVVTGLGLIGLMTAQLLQAHGCKVLGIDMDQGKLNIARQSGIATVDLSRGEDPVSAGMAFSGGRGIDGVIITAATQSSEPVHQAAQMCRKRGRIILVGITGLELSRADFYEKELSFQVSCSYGPGRYDPQYEQQGQDYPLGYVRWTEQRNFEAVLDMLAMDRLKIEPLISHRFSLKEAEKAYELLSSNEPYLGIILQYPAPEEQWDGKLLSPILHLAGSQTDQECKDRVGKIEPGHKERPVKAALAHKETHREGVSKAAPVISVIGAGNFTSQVMLPTLKKSGARLKSIASSRGVSGMRAARKFGFEETTTEAASVFSDSEVDAVFITTRHDTHTYFVLEGLNAGKHIFVEKPLCLSIEELFDITKACGENAGATRSTPDYSENVGSMPGTILMVGFNRRFSPHAQKMKSLLDSMHEPKSFIVTINAGAIPADHWTQDPTVGGGRIIGEACHFIDLLRYLVGHPIKSFQVTRMGKNAGTPIVEDKITITLCFEDGSFGSIHYLANGNKSFPKERVEVFCGGRILALDNFRVLKGYGWPGFKKMKLLRQDKGHVAGIQAFIEAVQQGTPSPIPYVEIEEVTRITLEIANTVRNGS